MKRKYFSLVAGIISCLFFSNVFAQCPTFPKSKKYWDRKTRKIYSKEFDGSINPGQFWRKRDYVPAGIMDPYND